MGYALAVLGFAAFLCHDYQSIGRLRWRGFRWGFAAGTVLWAAAFGWLIATCAHSAAPARLIPWGAAALVSLALEVYALFFALPFEKTYVRPEEARRVCRDGLYGLCRHPGFWPFAAFCGCLVLAMPCRRTLAGAGLLTVLDLAYIALQDAVIFPETFSDYSDYKTGVPFLFPDAAARRRFFASMKRRGRA